MGVSLLLQRTTNRVQKAEDFCLPLFHRTCFDWNPDAGEMFALSFVMYKEIILFFLYAATILFIPITASRRGLFFACVDFLKYYSLITSDLSSFASHFTPVALYGGRLGLLPVYRVGLEVIQKNSSAAEGRFLSKAC